MMDRLQNRRIRMNNILTNNILTNDPARLRCSRPGRTDRKNRPEQRI